MPADERDATTPESRQEASKLIVNREFDLRRRARHAHARWDRTVPARFAGAGDSQDIDPVVQRWVRTLIDAGLASPTGCLRTGPSMVLVGGTGPGKTHAAWWSIAQLARAGVLTAWEVISAPNLYASVLSYRPGVDPEGVFWTYAKAPFLVLDDYGAEPVTSRIRSLDYRLIDYRYQHMLPMMLTSNLAPSRVEGMAADVITLADVMDDRLRSRLVEMGTLHNVGTFDRRRGQMPGQTPSQAPATAPGQLHGHAQALGER